jgi:hypothetical protein
MFMFDVPLVVPYTISARPSTLIAGTRLQRHSAITPIIRDLVAFPAITWGTHSGEVLLVVFAAQRVRDDVVHGH